VRRLAPLLVSIALVAVVVIPYVALGGGAFEPTPVADPCQPRDRADAEGLGETIERIALQAVDHVACELGVSREELVLALRSVDDLDALARKEGKSRDDLEEALRAGLVRAVDEGESQGLIGGTTAGGLRFAADHLPLGLLLSVLRGASSILG